MAWAANEVGRQDVQGFSVGEYDADQNSDNEIDIDEFKDFAKEKYDLDENAATLIFSRENFEENGLFDEGGLNEEQFADVNENLAAFKDIAEKFDLKGMDKEVAIMLVGDKDGKMATENVQKLIDDKIIEVTDEGQMKFTEEGEKFNEYLHNEVNIFAKDIPEHYEDFKSGTGGWEANEVGAQDVEGMQDLAEGAAEVASESIAELNLQEKEGKPGTYTREGYDGEYTLRDDGSILYSGDDKFVPQTYKDGEWTAVEAQGGWEANEVGAQDVEDMQDNAEGAAA
ncbi:MAG: hypothetical protein CMD81_08250 [Gammaproteobacteria bacterium]|nr:hypothetical protein [Gammaproteobacteria bacterium]HBF07871.1 hypothetical protein [Gammaproteobacteria bacterium]|tara:strand:- start:449 stop:1300 length:852 start_codon:yes stop_codon:yes gene_type:complete